MYQEEREAVLCRQEEPPTGKGDAVEISRKGFCLFPIWMRI